jgi:hypothetical protein
MKQSVNEYQSKKKQQKQQTQHLQHLRYIARRVRKRHGQ